MPIDPRLTQYIQAELGKGFPRDRITVALTQSGYSAADVDSAFAQLSGDLAGAEALAASLARAGTPRGVADAQLRTAGYAPVTVKRALRDVYGVEETAGASGTSRAVVFALIALLVGAGGMWLLTADDDAPIGDDGSSVPVSFAPAEIIAQVLEIARADGADAAVRACKERLAGRERDLCVFDVAILPEVSDAALCDQVADPEYGDACYLNFLDVDPSGMCAKVRLAANRDTCERVARFSSTTGAA